MASLSLKGRTKNIANRSKKYLEEALYRRLFKDGGDEVTVRHNLNEFLKSRKRVYKWEVGDTIKKLRDRKHYFAALKLSDTMARRGMNMTLSDQAIHLDLIAKTHGIPAAENYFIDLPESSKNIECYGALLNSYCKESISDKAEALMEKMKELSLPITAMSYNSLMTMYAKNGQPERVPGLAQEMKASNIMLQVFTYNIWMRALAAVNDINGAERVLDEMKRDGRVAEDWTTYSNLASIYADAGMTDKAENALKELEKRNTSKELLPYQFLITLYGKTGNVVEIYRIWRSLRLAFPKTPNIAYLNMIQALINLKDMPGAEKCFKEWESGCLTYDIRIVNALIEAYIKDDLFDKAKELKQRADNRGAKANAKTWDIFLDYHVKKGKIKSAVDCVEYAITAGRVGGTEKWIPKAEVVSAMMQLFEQNKDVDGAEGFLELLKKNMDNLGAEVFESLIRTYAAAGRTSPSMGRRLKMENVEVNEECKKLLEVVIAE
ncbi:pentatricopeptide repeat-containing protein At1g60770 [Amaranthus tricolor]|uniref:pentatricopeptide repeat-containing protein At1g60770 n=1 Tax=Amaranthus tricolor TaxID=29722 RepID=UPI00258694F8|nr:pentatricopeptide repeat-containing protein At1g60770 [Amaranthus tricolor]